MKPENLAYKEALGVLIEAKEANKRNDLNWFENQLRKEEMQRELAHAKCLIQLHDMLMNPC